jgi:hypothetical protein
MKVEFQVRKLKIKRNLSAKILLLLTIKQELLFSSLLFFKRYREMRKKAESC